MYVYQITNLINKKAYIGITNNYVKRWSNHKCCNNPNMVIAKAIKKYGVDNFKFEILYQGLSVEEAEEKEIELIKNKNTQAPYGYNIQKGGFHNNGISLYGCDNNNASLTEEQVRFIKSHRNIPMYVLYEDFNEIITYDTFKKVYLNQTYKNIEPTVDPYPNNFEFSCQFNASLLDYGEVVVLRQKFAAGVYWREVYEDYKKLYTNEWSFWNIYIGNVFPLVMPEVFTKENKLLQSSYARRGAANGRATMTEEDAIRIRCLFKEGKTRDELCALYPNIKRATINMLLAGKTWKYLL